MAKEGGGKEMKKREIFGEREKKPTLLLSLQGGRRGFPGRKKKGNLRSFCGKKS